MSISTIVNNKSESKVIWDEHFDFYIDKDKYTVVLSHQLVGIYSILVVKNEHLPYMSSVRWSQVGFGKYGLGNKGCIAYQFDLFENSFCFINTHFESGQSKLKERNENHDHIINPNLFENVKYSPLQQDFLYVLGDLNYRIDLTREEVMECLEAKNYQKLMDNDQLSIGMNKKQIFKDFTEEKIQFNPTYKYEKGNKNFDTKKKRIPSYCDRILLRCDKEKYECIQGPEVNYDLDESDHRPLFITYKNILE
jgi:hypothetical protein